MTSKYSKRFTVPENFNEILQKLTREVLRDQPDDIIEYAALYFEALRDNKPFHYEAMRQHDNVGTESVTPQNKQPSKQPSKEPSQAEPSEQNEHGEYSEKEQFSPQASHHTQSEASELNGERGF